MASIDFFKLKEFCERLTVLYVEDDEEASENMKEILESLFYKVYTAKDGEEGLALFFDLENIDLVITDISMPKINGIQMSEKIREKNLDIPILIISAYSEMAYFIELIQVGIDGYLLKPLEKEQFINTLYKAIQKVYLKKTNEDYKENLEEKVEEKTKKLKEYFYIDKVTSLPNRYKLLEDIKVKNIQKLILLDINRFSNINDTYGTKKGDELLVLVAQRLSEIRPSFCKLFKVSVDQFAFASLDKNKEISCEEFVKQVNDLINNKVFKVEVDDLKIELNLSVTMAIIKNVNSSHLLEKADMALHYAKKTHQPYVKYSKELEETINNKKTFEAIKLIKEALDENRVVPYFQPIVKNENTSYESLVRVISKEGEVIPPYYFLDDIKHTPYYTQLTKVMIKKSFEYFSKKQNSFSINISFEDISNEHIISYLVEMIKEYKVEKKLIIEVLESESITNFEKVKSFINIMKSMGVQIAIDDFGSGYSNFHYLLELEPDYIKIDGSLIKDIDIDEKSFYITKSIVDFSKKLGIKIVAEYIHSQEVDTKVSLLGVDGKQGYYHGKPSSIIKEQK